MGLLLDHYIYLRIGLGHKLWGKFLKEDNFNLLMQNLTKQHNQSNYKLTVQKIIHIQKDDQLKFHLTYISYKATGESLSPPVSSHTLSSR